MNLNLVLTILVLCSATLRAEDKTVTAPALTSPAATAAQPLQAEPAKEAKQTAKHIVKNPEDPAMQKLQSMMAAFDDFSANKDKYINGEYDYAKYKKEEKIISDRISSFIDFYDVCEKSLKYDKDPKTKKFKKDHWKGKTQQQKNDFTALFRKLIEAIVYPATIDFFGKLKIEHSVLKNRDTETDLQSIIYYKKKDLIMEWFFHKQADGNWSVYDIGIEGERWVQSFRSQFNDIISKKSYKELLNMMDKKLKETLEDNEKKDQQAVKKKI